MDVLGPARDLATRKAIDLQIDYDSLASVEPAGASFKLAVAAGSQVLCARDAKVNPQVEVEIVGQDNLLVIGDRTTLSGTKFYIRGNGCLIVLGQSVALRNDRVTAIGDGAKVVLGRGTTMVGGGQLLAEAPGTEILVKDDCMFAHGVVLRTSDGHTIWDRQTGELINRPASILVQSHVWLANGARVSKGAEIGEGCVVAQNSLANGVLEPNSIYAGTPAKNVRGNIVWSRTQSFDGIPGQYR
jgi:acetyltransferase-like isoleucine patch superfamily enzyme